MIIVLKQQDFFRAAAVRMYVVYE